MRNPARRTKQVTDNGPMRRVMYAGGEFVTTDEVATILLRLTTGVGLIGVTNIIDVPIAVAGEGGTSQVAQLVVNATSEILSLPAQWEGEEPDFSGQAMMLQMHPTYPRTTTITVPTPSARTDGNGYDPEFGEW